MKRSERRELVMRAALAEFGEKAFSSPDLARMVAGLAAKQHAGLAEALKGRTASAKSLGWLLRGCQGMVLDEKWRVCAWHVTKPRGVDRWEYAFVDITDLDDDDIAELDNAEYEDRFAQAKSLTWRAVENGRQIEKVIAKEENQKALAAVTEPLEFLTRPVKMPDGRLETEVIRDREGHPVPAKTGAPAAEKAAESVLYNPRPAWVREKRQPTRAELAAEHARLQAVREGPDDWFVRACEARNRGY